MSKKNIITYFCVYLMLAFMLVLPFLFFPKGVEPISATLPDDDNKTKIELVCDDVVVGIISHYPGEKISYPSDIEKTLSSFTDIKGWYTDKSLTNEFVFDTQPQDNVILYAKTENVKTDNSFYIFWGVSIFSAISLGVLFYSLNKYYSKQNKDKPKKIT